MRSLALELAPRRVNAISPGITDTPFYSRMPDATKEERFAEMESSLPVGRIGRPCDIAEGIRFLICNEFTTGTTLDVDGGARLM